MSTIEMYSGEVNKLAKRWLDKEEEKYISTQMDFRKSLYIKRRLFGLLKPKYTKEQIDSWKKPDYYKSDFQIVYPDYKILALYLCTEEYSDKILHVDVNIAGVLKESYVDNLE
jgi:hypothetical protein